LQNDFTLKSNDMRLNKNLMNGNDIINANAIRKDDHQGIFFSFIYYEHFPQSEQPEHIILLAQVSQFLRNLGFIGKTGLPILSTSLNSLGLGS
jgi:hypothetical protein